EELLPRPVPRGTARGCWLPGCGNYSWHLVGHRQTPHPGPPPQVALVFTQRAIELTIVARAAFWHPAPKGRQSIARGVSPWKRHAPNLSGAPKGRQSTGPQTTAAPLGLERLLMDSLLPGADAPGY